MGWMSLKVPLSICELDRAFKAMIQVRMVIVSRCATVVAKLLRNSVLIAKPSNIARGDVKLRIGKSIKRFVQVARGSRDKGSVSCKPVASFTIITMNK